VREAAAPSEKGTQVDDEEDLSPLLETEVHLVSRRSVGNTAPRLAVAVFSLLAVFALVRLAPAKTVLGTDRAAPNVVGLSADESLAQAGLDHLNPLIPTLNISLLSLVSSSCAIDSVMATVSLAKAGMAIKHAVNDCNATNKALCAADAASITGALTGMGSFLSSAVYACTTLLNKTDVGAACAKGVLGLISSLSAFAQSMSQTTFSCPPNQYKYVDLEAEMGNRTNGTGIVNMSENSSIFSCVIDTVLAPNSLASAGQGIATAANACVHGVRNCTASALGIVGSFIGSASFIASAVNDCKPNGNVDAVCGAHILDAIGALTSVSAWAVETTYDCNATLLNAQMTSAGP